VGLEELARYLDEYLRVGQVGDSPEALNGLQVANSGKASRVGAAVDLNEATVRMAAEQGADFMLVHHGLFWGGLRPLVGPQYRRLARLLEHDIAVYSAHLPLDVHPEVGNNAVLARALGMAPRGTFGDHHGEAIGVWGELAISRDALRDRLAERLGGCEVKVMPFGPAQTGRVGIVTGSGGALIGQAAAAGLDTYITGEGSHHSYFDAEELGLNVYFAGHYATETIGVKALAEHLGTRFGLPWVFLHHPTGL
jgi:dinuclear metal center YbgI/SA1388 family protein